MALMGVTQTRCAHFLLAYSLQKIHLHPHLDFHVNNIPAENISVENIPTENIPAENIPTVKIHAENIPAVNMRVGKKGSRD